MSECCGFKIITGSDNLEPTVTVKSIDLVGSILRVTTTDGKVKDLELPTAEASKKQDTMDKIRFTAREAVVNLLINDTQLLFRELEGSNRPMLLTGIKYEGVWYGDAPDGKQAINPFTNEVVPHIEDTEH